MKLGNWTGWVAVAVISAGAGYYCDAILGVSQGDQYRASFETELASASFSEVENYKALLKAECTLVITEERVRVLAAMRHDGPGVGSPTSSVMNPEFASEMVRRMRRNIDEFKGSDQEFVITEELLCLLKINRNWHEWLNTYLRVLYENPTQRLVSRLAQMAIVAGEATGRDGEVLKAFQHLTRIPLDFTVKRDIARTVANLRPVGGAIFARSAAE